MKKRGKNDKRVKLIILIVIIILLILIAVIAYFLIFKKGVSYFGFTIPDFSGGAKLGDTIGGAANANVWEGAKLNPFGNES